MVVGAAVTGALVATVVVVSGEAVVVVVVVGGAVATVVEAAPSSPSVHAAAAQGESEGRNGARGSEGAAHARVQSGGGKLPAVAAYAAP